MGTPNGSEALAKLQLEVEELRRDVNILLRAQVLQKDQVDTHEVALTRIEAGIERLTEAGRQTDERIGKLVLSIGDLIQAMKSQSRS
jgi:hypothetical protein